MSLFDLYEGDKIGLEKKSMALHITLRKEDGTLLDSESKEVMDKIVALLKTSFLAEVRS